MNVEWMAWADVTDEFMDETGAHDVGTWGGFMSEDMRWDDYIANVETTVRNVYEAIRLSVVKNWIWEGGDWHQRSDKGVPFITAEDDSTYVALFSMRAWGDLMAAIWSTFCDKGFHYMDFYYGTVDAQEYVTVDPSGTLVAKKQRQVSPPPVIEE